MRLMTFRKMRLPEQQNNITWRFIAWAVVLLLSPPPNHPTCNYLNTPICSRAPAWSDYSFVGSIAPAAFVSWDLAITSWRHSDRRFQVDWIRQRIYISAVILTAERYRRRPRRGATRNPLGACCAATFAHADDKMSNSNATA